MAAVVSARDPRFLYIGGLVLPVSSFLMAVQCRVRRDADRRKRHRHLNNRHHHQRSAAAAAAGSMAMVNGGGQPTAVTETIPLQNIGAPTAGGGGDHTLRRQFQGNVYQCVGQRDGGASSNYDDGGGGANLYETASDPMRQ